MPATPREVRILQQGRRNSLVQFEGRTLQVSSAGGVSRIKARASQQFNLQQQSVAQENAQLRQQNIQRIQQSGIQGTLSVNQSFIDQKKKEGFVERDGDLVKEVITTDRDRSNPSGRPRVKSRTVIDLENGKVKEIREEFNYGSRLIPTNITEYNAEGLAIRQERYTLDNKGKTKAQTIIDLEKGSRQSKEFEGLRKPSVIVNPKEKANQQTFKYNERTQRYENQQSYIGKGGYKRSLRTSKLTSDEIKKLESQGLTSQEIKQIEQKDQLRSFDFAGRQGIPLDIDKTETQDVIRRALTDPRVAKTEQDIAGPVTVISFTKETKSSFTPGPYTVGLPTQTGPGITDPFDLQIFDLSIEQKSLIKNFKFANLGQLAVVTTQLTGAKLLGFSDKKSKRPEFGDSVISDTGETLALLSKETGKGIAAGYGGLLFVGSDTAKPLVGLKPTILPTAVKAFSADPKGTFLNVGEGLGAEFEQRPAKVFGEITSLEAPAVAFKTFRALRNIGARRIPEEEIFDVRVLSGESTFPVTAGPEADLLRFRRQTGTPLVEVQVPIEYSGVRAKTEVLSFQKVDDKLINDLPFSVPEFRITQTSTPDSALVGSDVALAGKRSGEVQGIFVTPATEGSPNFLRIPESSTPLEFSFFPKFRNPQVVRIGVPEVERIPGNILKTKNIDEINAFLKSQSPEGKAFLTAKSEFGGIEIEAVIPEGTRLVPGETSTRGGIRGVIDKVRGYESYTTFRGEIVPIRNLKTSVQNPSARTDVIIDFGSSRSVNLDFVRRASSDLSRSGSRQVTVLDVSRLPGSIRGTRAGTLTGSPLISRSGVTGIRITSGVLSPGFSVIPESPGSPGSPGSLRSSSKTTTTSVPPLVPPVIPITPPRTSPGIPITPRRPVLRFPSLSLDPIEEEKKEGTLQAYDVFVRQNNKYLKANDKKLSRQNALSLGARQTDNTTSASFQIRKSGRLKQTQSTDSYYDFTKYKFRSPKKGNSKDTFIEKTQYRIDTFGEVQGIPFKGIKVRKQKALFNIGKKLRGGRL